MTIKSLNIKSIAIFGVAVLLLSSCGNKLYSYRKTVRVKSTITKGQPKVGQPKAYITVQEVKSTKPLAKPTSMLEMDVEENTIYNTTKPLPEKEVATVGIVAPVYGATIR